MLTGIGVYALNTKDPEAVAARERIEQLVTSVPHVLQMHGFFMDREEKILRFDIIISFDAADRRQVYRDACEKVQKEYPDYTLQAAMDIDFSEINEQ